MTFSIRKFLLINLLLTVAITTTVTAIGNYFIDQKDIELHLDDLLAQSTLSFQALLGEDFLKRDHKDITAALEKARQQAKKFYENRVQLYHRDFGPGKYELQVWSDDGKLLLRTPDSPAEHLSPDNEGFSDISINDQPWRVFASHNDRLGFTIVAAERDDLRSQLAEQVAKDDFLILVAMFPLAGLLIWFIVGRGLNALRRVAEDVAQRAPNNLTPVETTGVPTEIEPVVSEINNLLDNLKDALEREKRFAGDAAHELRTPLAALKTQTQVALKTDDATERLASLKNVLSSVDRSTHIVQQLLTLSRLAPEASRIEDITRLNICQLTAEIIADLVPRAMKKKITVELHSKKEKIYLEGNVTALGILVRNLVDNAIRYTQDNGTVDVTIKELSKTKEVQLTVTDDGPGIPEELRQRVFERFFRVLGNQSPGSGLGLAIVKQIVRLHLATIALKTPPSGKGLSFIVTLKKTLKK